MEAALLGRVEAAPAVAVEAALSGRRCCALPLLGRLWPAPGLASAAAPVGGSRLELLNVNFQSQR